MQLSLRQLDLRHLDFEHHHLPEEQSVLGNAGRGQARRSLGSLLQPPRHKAVMS